MAINLEAILYIYLFVSICIIIFNIINIGSRKINKKYQEKLTKAYLHLITEKINQNKYDKNHYKMLCQKLKHITELTAFNSAITELFKNNEKETRKYLLIYKDAFNYLVQIYREKSTIYRAYFAYLMYEYKLCTSTSSNYITETMILFINDNSIYVRENAMKALISFGNADNIITVLKIINRLNYDYQKKVLTDDLLEFKGNSEELCRKLVDSLKMYREEIQLGIINYITYASDSYKEDFYRLLINKKSSKDIKIALIRYFAKYFYEPVVSILYKELNSRKVNDWELAAVSAFALKNYKSTTTKNELINALANPNWYIRKNSAKSLIMIGLTQDDIKKIRSINDKYANEILIYEVTKDVNEEMK